MLIKTTYNKKDSNKAAVTDYFDFTTAELLNEITCIINKIRSGEIQLHAVSTGGWFRDDMPIFRLSLYTYDKDGVLLRYTFRDISYFNYSLIQYVGSFNEKFKVALMSYPGGIVLDDDAYLDEDEYAEMQKLQRYIDNYRKNNLGLRWQ